MIQMILRRLEENRVAREKPEGMVYTGQYLAEAAVRTPRMLRVTIPLTVPVIYDIFR